MNSIAVVRIFFIDILFCMKETDSCKRVEVVEALKRLPNPEGKRFATIFEQGSLLVEIYAPRGTDPQSPHTRDEVYFVVAGTGEYVGLTFDPLLEVVRLKLRLHATKSRWSL
jgi:hypothetical protein